MANTSPATDPVTSPRRIFECLADESRRRCLAVLGNSSGPVPSEALATNLAAALADESPVTVTEAQHRRRHTRLVHVHLPKLAEAGMVTRDRESGTVRSTDHPVYRKRRYQRPIAAAGDWDAVLSALADGRRRLAVAALLAADEPLTTGELVGRVLARDRGESPSDVAEEAIEDATVDFHHVHLPKLEAAGLVTGDDDHSYAARTAPAREWVESVLALSSPADRGYAPSAD